MIIAYLPLRLGEVLSPKARVYEILAVEDGQVVAHEPRQVVVLPEKAISVSVRQEASSIVLPEGSIRVTALPPPPRKSVVRKKIIYDKGSGRPDEIEETTTEE